MQSILSFYSFIPTLATTGLAFVLVSLLLVIRSSKDRVVDENMMSLAKSITSGTYIFLKKQYSILLLILILISLILYTIIGFESALTYLFGALSSMLCGLVGIFAATKSHYKAAVLINIGRPKEAFSLAFYAASILGVFVACSGLLGIYLASTYLTGSSLDSLTAFAMGASTSALLTRVGGGIYTKAADVGAGLMEELALSLPQEDPQNPVTIVDHVGDNVGGTAGSGVDIYESYCGSLIATMYIGAIVVPSHSGAFMLPLLTATLGLFAAIITIFLSGLIRRMTPQQEQRILPLFAITLMMAGSFFLVDHMDFSEHFSHALGPFYSMLTGALIGLLMGISAEYYTSIDGPWVRRIAYASKTGPATNVLGGIAMAMYSCVVPILLICFGVMLSHSFAGLYGIGMAAVGMISTVGITLTIDAQRPIIDNAFGVASVGQKSTDVYKTKQSLAGTTAKTATLGKSFSVATAAFTGLALFAAFATATGLETMSLVDPRVVLGLFIGGVLPFFVAGNLINAVGNAAQKIIHEVKLQLTLGEKTENKPSLSRANQCIRIATKASLKQMVKPGIVAIAIPILMGLVFGKEALSGLLAGTLVSGILLAIFLTNAGGAWDSVKKLIDLEKIVGEDAKGLAHHAAVVGDSIGDPFKDTAGPALNILVKLVAIVALVIAPMSV